MSNKIIFLSQEDISKCLDMASAIDAMKFAFSELSNNNVNVPIRMSMPLKEDGNGALFMPVYFPPRNLVGIKSVMIHEDNPTKGLPMIHAIYNVFDAETGKPLAIIDGECLTSLRTGAASGLATEIFSSQDAKSAVIFGAGKQSEKQIDAICTVRDLERIYISDLVEERVKELISKMQPLIKAELLILKEESDIKEADIICTATSSSKPVFDHNNLNAKVHINGIGSFRPDMCEIPEETIINSKLIVDSREACLAEAGDIIQPIKNNKITSDHIYAEIGEVINSNKSSKNNDDKITVFKSVGNAVQDIAAAALILDNAKKLNVGREIKL